MFSHSNSFAAIKSCRDPVVLNILNNLGVSFDCTNKVYEIDNGVSRIRLIRNLLEMAESTSAGNYYWI